MPEGHSVHRLARQFNDVFGGAALAVSSPQGKFTAGAARIDGHVLELGRDYPYLATHLAALEELEARGEDESDL